MGSLVVGVAVIVATVVDVFGDVVVVDAVVVDVVVDDVILNVMLVNVCR